MPETAIERRIPRHSYQSQFGYRWRLSACIALFVVASSIIVSAQSKKPGEYDVKAAYLYNFGKFIKWPPKLVSSEPVFPICILGTDPFGHTIDSIASGEALDGKRLSIVRVSSAIEAQPCRILFIGRSEQVRVGSILATVNKWPILTVSDMPDFLDHGGIIEFVMQGDRVRFQVNLAAAEHSGLLLSSELLKVAVSVKRINEAGE